MKKIFLVTFILIGIRSISISQNLPVNIPNDKLLGWWSFDSNANDISGNAYHASVVGAQLANDRFGVPNRAYSFDGGDYMNIDSSDLMAFGKSSYTISAWFKSNMIGDGNIVRYDCINAPCISEVGILLRLGRDSNNAISTGNIQFSEHDGSATVTIASPLKYNDNKWHIVTVVKDTSKMLLTMYVDGKEVINHNLTRLSNVGRVKPLNFGALHNGYEAFNGFLDDIGIWGKALTKNQVVALHLPLPSNIVADGLIGWWPFSGNALDSSGNNHHGTVFGTQLTNDRFGSSQKAYAFGQGKYINIDSSDFMALGKSPYTISAWFKTEMLSDGNILRYDCVSSPCMSEVGILLRIGRDSSNSPSPGNLQFSEHDGTATVTIASPLRYNDGKWHIVTILKDTINMTVTMLVDGVNVSSKKLTRISNVGKVKPLNFGALHFNYEPFTGSIDDIGVWKRTLTIDEVKNLNTKPVNTGAVELDLVNNILIYPNPCKESLNITLDDHRFNNQPLEIVIMDSYGKLMIQKTIESNKSRIDEVESLNPGIYFIRLTDSNHSISVVKKFVKENSK